MDQLISAVLALAIMAFGIYCLGYSTGAVKVHPVTWAGGMIGSAIMFAVRLPLRLLGGIAQGVTKGKRRKRRRLR